MLDISLKLNSCPSVMSIADDEWDVFPESSPKRRKVEKVGKNGKTIHVLDCEEEEKENEDWLPPPPKFSRPAGVLAENSTIKELRLMKQELLSCAQSAEDILRDIEESAKGEVGKSLQPSLDAIADQPSRPHNERAKIVISVQDKDGLKQFRIYMDDKFERLFKLYADKVKLDQRSLVFCFDGEKIGPEATPNALEMEDSDIIEVHVKSS
ncbi:hypothetical protein TIFTF001_007888 [Ficus carica]|uniref:Rad60/SUMO-like domain-containing protein n=1 Tax=Ficus carica TaxID=3494 RepID=A0AA87ZKC9_FICCA|nr:hypothetical protein TIFTF001_007888 [Ficus carica]